MSKKDTLENMMSIAISRGGSCLSDEYVNQKTPLKWQCKKGHIWLAKPADVKGNRRKKGTWCPTCGIISAAQKRKHNKSKMMKLAKSRGGSFVSESYRGSQHKHRWRCGHFPEHPEFKMTANAVQQGQWCPKCSNNAKPTLSDLDIVAKTRHPKARCLSNTYVNSISLLSWQCGVEEYGTFEKSYRSVKFDGAWCKKCKKDAARSSVFDRKMIEDFAIRAGGKLVTEGPIKTTRQKLRWSCPDGHEFFRNLDSIISYKSFCPVCSKRNGLREQQVRELFFHLFLVPFDRVKSLPWLVNSRGNSMELDGYNAELGVAFEHNGEQHYKLDGFYASNSAKLQIRINDDKEKARLCKENGVILIVVPFDIPIREISDYVKEKLSELGIQPKNEAPYKPGIFSSSVLNKLQEYAKAQGGKILSEKYLGSMEKHKWSCGNEEHAPFEATPSSVLSGKWCKKCANEKASESYRAIVKDVMDWAKKCDGVLVGHSPETTFSLSEKAQFKCNRCNQVRTRTVRQVKQGKLCLCQTKRTRINRPEVEKRIEGTSIRFIGPNEFKGGKTKITIECRKCATQWETRASYIMNSSTGCPQCRKNSPVDKEKAKKLGSRIGFALISETVKSGAQNLEWICEKCGYTLIKPYREMRNRRRCPNCKRREFEKKLGVQEGDMILNSNQKMRRMNR